MLMHWTRVVGCQAVCMTARYAEGGPSQARANERRIRERMRPTHSPHRSRRHRQSELAAAAGVRQLFREALEPGRQEEELIDLVRGYARRLRLGRRVDGVD